MARVRSPFSCGERVNCTSSSPLKIYVTPAFVNSLIFFVILSSLLSLLISLSPPIYFLFIFGFGKITNKSKFYARRNQ